MINMEHLYKTCDMGLVAYLSMKSPITAMEPDDEDPRKRWFRFTHSEKLQKKINNYWAGKAKVEPQAYFAAIKTLKNRLYNEG